MKTVHTLSILILGIVCILSASFALRHCALMEHRLNKLNKIIFTPGQPGSNKPAGILHPIAADGYLWIRHAQNMVKERHWRLNHTNFDNSPNGRDVHWHSGFAWWLIGLGWIKHTFSGVPFDRAIALSAVWANTIILACYVILLPFLLCRRFGIMTAIVLAIGMLSCREFYEHFIPAYPDHHGVIGITALCSVLFLLMAGAGWVRGNNRGHEYLLFPKNEQDARLWIIVAAFFSAAALWTSAVSQVLLMVGLGLGILGSVWLFAEGARKEDLHYHPHIWALWGRFGAGFSLFFYLLEYFPDRMGMQLLVNHPLHALAWLGGGEVLAILTGFINRSHRPTKRDWYWLSAGVFLIALYPACILFGNPEWWDLRDPFMVALHKTISEFRPILPRLMDGTVGFWSWIWSNLFFLVSGVVILFLRRLPAGCRAIILLPLIPTLLFTALSFYQTRWSSHCGSLYIILLTVVMYTLLNHFIYSSKNRKKTGWIVYSIVLIILIISPIRVLKKANDLASPNKRLMVSLGEGRDLLTREIGLKVRQLSKGKEAVILSSPNTTLRSCYFGNHKGIGTLYWENLAGLKSAAAIFSTTEETEAQRLIKEHGITHIVFTHAPNAMFPHIDTYFDLYNLNNNKPKLEDCFAYKLFYTRQIPAWLRQIPFPKNVLTNLLKAEVMILEVTERKNYVSIN